MSEQTNKPANTAIDGNPDCAYNQADVNRYYAASLDIENNRHHIEEASNALKELEHNESVELFQKQVELLKKRLVNDPQFFAQTFITEGTNAIAWEFQQEDLGEAFTRTFWDLLLKNDAMSIMLMRFIWNIPLKFKRKFVRALDRHLSDRYPMFRGLSENWPADNNIPPYILSLIHI